MSSPPQGRLAKLPSGKPISGSPGGILPPQGGCVVVGVRVMVGVLVTVGVRVMVGVLVGVGVGVMVGVLVGGSLDVGVGV